MRITLSNGEVLNDVRIQGDSVTGVSKGVLLSDNIVVSIDDELLYGATIEVEYTITLENLYVLPCFSYIIKDIKDNKFIYRDDQMLITENVPNSHYGWKPSSDGKYIDCSYKGDFDFPSIMPGQKIVKKIVLTKLLSDNLSDDFYTYENSAKAELEFIRSNMVYKEADSKDVNLLPPFGRPYFIEICSLSLFISIIILYFIYRKKSS